MARGTHPLHLARAARGLALVLTAFLASGCADERCAPRASQVCSGGATYWVDSCGQRGELVEACACGCNAFGLACMTCGCQPDCEGRECGPDGCQGTCLPGCPAGQACDEAAGACYACAPECVGRECGPDGCGRSCAPGCASGEACDERTGRCEAPCVPDCQGRVCGEDGCGGSCGACQANASCTPAGDACACDGPACGLACCAAGAACTPQGCCTPSCVGLECGDDGCGGTCGACEGDELCVASLCCAPACAGKVCGDDGCGGACGDCPAGSACSPDGAECLCPGPFCLEACCSAGEVCWQDGCCRPSCLGKECGDDGCGGSCGGCPPLETCRADRCVCANNACGGECCAPDEVCWLDGCCAPTCAGLACGEDGCGGICGACGPGEVCDEASATCQPGDAGLEWVAFPAGSYLMGTLDGEGSVYESPQHTVTLQAFEMTRTEVSVRQYRRCYLAGACTAPALVEGSTWGDPARLDHPVNAVDLPQAEVFCTWAGGRVPSEAEWEYAARSGGLDLTFPWGNELLSCGLANYDDWADGGPTPGCGLGWTAPVCSRSPQGDSLYGLCDLLGNVWEWVADSFHDSYLDAPADGSAWIDHTTTITMMRGGGYQTLDLAMHTRYRGFQERLAQEPWTGIRCVR